MQQQQQQQQQRSSSQHWCAMPALHVLQCGVHHLAAPRPSIGEPSIGVPCQHSRVLHVQCSVAFNTQQHRLIPTSTLLQDASCNASAGCIMQCVYGTA